MSEEDLCCSSMFDFINECLVALGQKKIDLLFLRHFFEKTNARGRIFFFLRQIFFISHFPVNSMFIVRILSILPLIIKNI